jgi:hydrogenase maturation protein HypF
MRAEARRILVFGVVQGVGFRPFIHRLALRLGCRGWVKNVAGGVEIHLESDSRTRLADFLRALGTDKPPLAVIETVTEEPAQAEGLAGFEVRRSTGGNGFVFISPDISVCPSCLADISEPGNRRFAYPFTNCTDCGPRYTIVRALPYDRPQTTMSGFPMCPDCAAEYKDPSDRRYHAQPIACPACGPTVRLRKSGSPDEVAGGIEAAAAMIRRGRIVAVKGLGGFHLMVDPFQPKAVARLRAVKERLTKPLALMARDMASIRMVARVSAAEERLLRSPQRPIVLLKKKVECPGIAPYLDEIGVMLAYTPLHELLLRGLRLVVATSSNPKDSPIMKEEDEGLDALCDYVLGHDRPIHMRADDSLLKSVRGGPLFIRRARGYVPSPQRIPESLRTDGHILALGAELKDTVTIYKNGYAVTSQFLGDLDEYRSHRYFEETTAHLEKLFGVRPERLVSDLHPGFHTTRWAERLSRRLGIPHDRVQHHHAHVLAVLLEHGLPPGPPVLGVAWDGYGYGADGTAWGGEFLLAGYNGCERFAHFEPIPLPGGDWAAREPWRMALAYLSRLDPDRRPEEAKLFPAVPKRKLAAVRLLLERSSHLTLASSAGRLFDAVSALAGLAPSANGYEAEAAMRLESAAARFRGTCRAYPFVIEGAGVPYAVSFKPMTAAVLDDRRRRIEAAEIAAKFHATLVKTITETARRARRERGTETIVLCGGVFLNRILLESAARRLERIGFRVLRPMAYSPNDEAISLGQIAFGLARRRSQEVNRSS